MTERGVTIRRLWRPRAIARVAVPLLLFLVVITIDRQVLALATERPSPFRPSWVGPALHYALVLVAVVLIVYAVRAFIQALSRTLDAYMGLARARSTATFLSVILYTIAILIIVNEAGIDLSGLLVGGALTGVVVGIAGQASLSNIIAGLVILFARPYSAGMYITARTGVFGGVEYSGQVWDISLFYTTLHSADQEVRIPNNAMVGAVVVLRPQETDVYIPLTLPRSADLPAYLDRLRHDVEGSTEARRTPHVTLESVTEVGYVVGMRVFVAGEDERRAVEEVVARLVRDLDAVPGEEGSSTPDTASRTGVATGPDGRGERG